MSALQRQVDKLKTLGVNKIIALGHSGFTVDQEVAKRVRGVDVVIGGHSNTFLYTGKTNSAHTGKRDQSVDKTVRGVEPSSVLVVSRARSNACLQDNILWPPPSVWMLHLTFY